MNIFLYIPRVIDDNKFFSISLVGLKEVLMSEWSRITHLLGLGRLGRHDQKTQQGSYLRGEERRGLQANHQG
jgi:hypothetical protein